MTEEQLQELKHFAELDATEVGDVTLALLHLASYRMLLSDALQKALDEQLSIQFLCYKDQMEIIKKEIITTVEELEFK